MTATRTEDRVLALLRNRYEGEGFSFIEHPDQANLPSFMKGYRPDALALGKDKSIAIELKLHRRSATEESLRAVSERFKGQPHWEFRVVYGDEVEDEPIHAPTREQILAQIVEAETIFAQNYNRAAFVLGWAAIEAIARTLDPDFPSSGSRTMRQAVELLEHTGRLRFQQAQDLRRLSPLHDKQVHGDFQTPIGADDVKPVLEAARAALDASSEV